MCRINRFWQEESWTLLELLITGQLKQLYSEEQSPTSDFVHFCSVSALVILCLMLANTVLSFIFMYNIVIRSRNLFHPQLSKKSPLTLFSKAYITYDLYLGFAFKFNRKTDRKLFLGSMSECELENLPLIFRINFNLWFLCDLIINRLRY